MYYACFQECWAFQYCDHWNSIHSYFHSPILSYSMQLQADVDTYGPVLAILVTIGGLDTRPRLGGLVHHEELGPGTVVKIEAKSKVVVLFHGRKAIKSCNIGAVRAVSFKSHAPWRCIRL